MSAEQLFPIANALAMLAWLALGLVPLRQRWPQQVAAVVAAVLALGYTALIGAFFAAAPGGFGSLEAVGQLFRHPGVLLAGWVHYLAFDLLVGRWQREQARAGGWPLWQLTPVLVLTFLFGPIGWLVFLAVRSLRGERAAPATA